MRVGVGRRREDASGMYGLYTVLRSACQEKIFQRPLEEGNIMPIEEKRIFCVEVAKAAL
jgi:hypothetical protein